MSETPVSYTLPGHVPFTGPRWEAYQKAVAQGMGPAKATWPTFDVFCAGYAAGLLVCDRECCAQMRLEP